MEDTGKPTWTKEMTSGSDIAGNTVNEAEEVKERWKQHIESLHDKDEKPKDRKFTG